MKNRLEDQLDQLFPGDVPEPDKPPASETVAPAETPVTEPPPVADESAAGESPVVDKVPPVSTMLSLEERPVEPVTRPARQRKDAPKAKRSLAGVESLTQGRTRILNLLLGAAAAGGTVAMLALVAGAVDDFTKLRTYAPYFAGYVLIVVMFFWRRVADIWRASALFVVAYTIALLSIRVNGMVSTAPWYLFGTSMLFFILVGARAGVVSALVNVLLFVGAAWAYHVGWLEVQTDIDLAQSFPQFMVVSATFVLISLMVAMVQWMFARTQIRVMGTIQAQNESLQQARELSEVRQRELAQVNESLRRQTSHFELSARVGDLATRALSPDAFVSQAVKLVRDQLDLYEVSLFLLDPKREHLVLQAWAGKDDETLDRALRLRVDRGSALGQCMYTKSACICVQQDELLGVEFVLANTQSMLVLPLVTQGDVAGVMTLQSAKANAFNEQDVTPLRTIADQIAVAIAYDRVVVVLQDRLQEVEALQRYYVRERWEQFLPTVEQTVFQYTQPGVAALETPEIDGLAGRLAAGDVDAPLSSGQNVMVPIAQRGHVIGLLGLQAEGEEQALTEGQISLVRAVSEQMELILDNARLFEEARLRAGQERKVRDVAARMRETLDVESVLRTAADEMYRALGLDEVVIRLATQDAGAAATRDGLAE